MLKVFLCFQWLSVLIYQEEKLINEKKRNMLGVLQLQSKLRTHENSIRLLERSRYNH